MELSVRFLSAEDELEAVVNQINSAEWDEANDMGLYSAEALSYYLEQQDNLFAVCYLKQESSSELAGVASARVQSKPYDRERWLYIDEVDTAANLRGKGVGTALMKLLLDFADENDLEEAWLGTEIDNDAANALYRSLDPDEVERFVGYTFELD